ncbi:MAG: methylated-DNA--[protein]-cysteine S-methyltransferase [Clostridiales bacterium]|jgi:methylated-DNA-[protein]-cysteine S-methyltransferase|nr:methylated-DNA--[protein]-cysteine S-methyltransferase [Clostridiales bacterium]
MYYSNYLSPLCTITLASDGNSIAAAWMEGQKYYGGTVSEALTEKNDLPVFTAAKNWLDRYFNGQKPSVNELPLAPYGNDFRREVWRALCEIPYGEVTVYGNIAKKIAVKMNKSRMSAQAIGGAVGHNPISIIIPCHRVVGANGSLTGYAGGIDKKVKLLEYEGVDMTHLHVPVKGSAL